MPQVSVVLIFLNEERYLEEAVQSVFDQRLADWELILVDDGSTDRSTLIARGLATGDDRIRYVDHPGHENRGMSASRNLGVANATAPYIAFLDADDAWMPYKLAEHVDLLDNMPDMALVVGAIQYWYSWDPASTKADRVVLTGGMADRGLDPPEPLLALYPLGPGGGAGVTRARPAQRLRRGRRVRRAFPWTLRGSGVPREDLLALSHLHLVASHVPLPAARHVVPSTNVPDRPPAPARYLPHLVGGIPRAARGRSCSRSCSAGTP